MMRADLTGMRLHLRWVRLAAQGKADLAARERDNPKRYSPEQVARDDEFAAGLSNAADWIAEQIANAEKRLERKA